MATLYVSNSTVNGYALGVDTNNGLTKAAPKLSIEAAIVVASDGDTVIVNSGSYNAATYFALGKAITLVPEVDYGVTLTAIAGGSGSVLHINNTTGAVEVGKFVIDPTTSAQQNGVTLNAPTGSPTRTLRGTRIVSGTINAIKDDAARGVVNLIGVQQRGSGGSAGYVGTTNAGQSYEKTVNIEGYDFGDYTVGSGAYIGISVNRHASAAAPVHTEISGVTGILRANPSYSNSYVIGVSTNNVSSVDIHSNDFDVVKDGISASVECLCIVVASSSAVAYTTSGAVYDNTVGMYAPAGSIIKVGSSLASDNSKNVSVHDNTIYSKYYSAATPHGIYLGGLDSTSSAYKNTIYDVYVGAIMSMCQGTLCFSNIMDGIYGADLYAKGCGAISAPIFANNTMIKRNRVGNMRAGLACMAANIQGATANTDTLFVNNRIVQVDMDATMVYVASGQSATFERNGYPKSSALTTDSFSWQGTSQDFATWKAAHEADAAQEFARISVTTDGKLSAGSRLCHSSKAVTGVTDSGEEDPFGNEFPTYPNIGADQYDYAKGFGPWTPFDTSMPTLSLAATCPGSLLEVQEWTKLASARDIERY